MPDLASAFSRVAISPTSAALAAVTLCELDRRQRRRRRRCGTGEQQHRATGTIEARSQVPELSAAARGPAAPRLILPDVRDHPRMRTYRPCRGRVHQRERAGAGASGVVQSDSLGNSLSLSPIADFIRRGAAPRVLASRLKRVELARARRWPTDTGRYRLAGQQ